MTATDRQTDHTVARPIALLIICVAALGLIALAGCGSSSKPAYCSARTNLENSIKQIESLTPTSGISALQAAYTKIKANANTVVNEAKGAFPNETAAIKSSVDSLTSAVTALRSNPSAGNITTVAGAAANVVTAFKGFIDASKSKCS